jgi:protein ImuB
LREAEASGLGRQRKSPSRQSGKKPARGTSTGDAHAAHAADSPPRPVWLQQAEPLAERAARPLLEGRPLQLLSGPERIEAGWWDEGLTGRDYFIAAAADGALVWIYRERLPLSRSANEDVAAASGWFLHGRSG